MDVYSLVEKITNSTSRISRILLVDEDAQKSPFTVDQLYLFRIRAYKSVKTLLSLEEMKPLKALKALKEIAGKEIVKVGTL